MAACGKVSVETDAAPETDASGGDGGMVGNPPVEIEAVEYHRPPAGEVELGGGGSPSLGQFAGVVSPPSDPLPGLEPWVGFGDSLHDVGHRLDVGWPARDAHPAPSVVQHVGVGVGQAGGHERPS